MGKEEGTRGRLLEAACRVFAEKGFRDATIAEICARAGANIAAVNYYFRSKEKLYVEAWREAFHASIAKYPPDGGAPADAPAAERLKGRILSLMRRVADPDCLEFEIVQKELASPTGLLAEVKRQSLEPLRKAMTKLVGELLGEGTPDEVVEFCQMSIMAQCMFPLMHRRHLKVMKGESVLSRPPDFAVERLAEHVLRFSLGGVRAVKERTGRRGR